MKIKGVLVMVSKKYRIVLRDGRTFLAKEIHMQNWGVTFFARFEGETFMIPFSNIDYIIVEVNVDGK